MKTHLLLVLCFTLLPVAQAQYHATDSLNALLDETWAFQLRENPLFATTTGNAQYNDRLPEISVEAENRRAAYWQTIHDRLNGIDRDALDQADQINYDVFARSVRDRLNQHRFRAYLIPLTVDSGFHTSFVGLPNRMPFRTVENYENYIARLRAFPAYVDQYIALLQTAVDSGFTLPRVVLDGYEVTIEGQIVDEAEQSGFFEPFTSLPPSVSADEHERLRAEGQTAVMNAVAGYQAFLDFMTNTYIPGARTTTGASELPNGEAYYDYLIEHFTTLDLSAEDVHEIGLGEVARIRSEMEAIIQDVGFEGDFEAFLAFLRTDPQFYVDTPEALLKEAMWIAKRMDGKLPSLFKTLPRLPYGVEPVPDHLAPKYTGGRYVRAATGSTESGTYWVNTYALDSRPLYVLEALTLHEAVPGHHLQIALQQELEDLHPFRRYAGVTAFSEGWGLYAERLGLEAGFYTDPYSNFGRLTYEMWRACRLVVDTGLHAMNWTRDEARDFLASNTALSLHEVGTEIDRYISWPGQALAYKIGELKIRELRQQAEQQLGERFDVRTFHDVVLRNGAIPLPVLEEEVQRYIESGS